jgi:plastocyanin
LVPVRPLALLSALIFTGAACAPTPSRPTSAPKPAATRAAAPAASPGASPVASAPANGEPVTVGGLTYNSFGFREAAGEAARDLDAGDFFFKGTFLRGNANQKLKLRVRNTGQGVHNLSIHANQKLKLRVRNTGQGVHNLSIPAQGVDREIPTGGQRVEVEVTFPESGALRFFCKLHESRGMNGQLLVGEIEPQPVADASPANRG